MSKEGQYINPFVSGAFSVLSMMLGETPTRGQLAADASTTTHHQVNVVVGVTGEARGSVVIGMSLITADKVASKMIGEPVRTFDSLAASAISELG
ncbi:MAG TPA: chemotaxis protein CheX, partial [Fimbriimonas sp.]|nr:chemotaxis protein CheX [Fimbriimonas sp.]